MRVEGEEGDAEGGDVVDEAVGGRLRLLYVGVIWVWLSIWLGLGDSHGCRTRSLRVIAGVRTVAALLGLMLLLASAAAAASHRTVSDGVLRVPLPPGWFGSVGRGMQGTNRVAWIIVANFRLAADAARDERTPRVPRGKVVLAIGDFFPAGAPAHWPVVSSLRLPRALLIRSGHWWWHVRYAGRSVAFGVTFGARPNGAIVTRVEQLLAAITR